MGQAQNSARARAGLGYAESNSVSTASPATARVNHGVMGEIVGGSLFGKSAMSAAIDRELAQLGMEDLGYSSDEHLQPSAKLSLFFKGVATALQRLRERIPKQLANESRKICAGVLQKVLMKVAFRNPGLSFTNVLKSLPPDADWDALKALVAPIVDKVSGIKRVEGDRVD